MWVIFNLKKLDLEKLGLRKRKAEEEPQRDEGESSARACGKVQLAVSLFAGYFGLSAPTR